MSTYWYPKCIDPTCELENDYSDCSLNHGEDVIRNIYKFRKEIRDFQKLMDDNNIDVWLDSGYTGGIIHFMSRHADCKLILENEYGDRESIEEPLFTYWPQPKHRNYFSYQLPYNLRRAS